MCPTTLLFSPGLSCFYPPGPNVGKQAINKNVLPFPVIRVLPTFFIIKPTGFLIGWFSHPNAAYRTGGTLNRGRRFGNTLS